MHTEVERSDLGTLPMKAPAGRRSRWGNFHLDIEKKIMISDLSVLPSPLLSKIFSTLEIDDFTGLDLHYQ